MEKLAIEHGPDAHLTLEHVEGAAAHSAERQVWSLVDALVAGDGRAATAAFLELRAQGESMPRLVPLMARRVRDVLAIALRLEAGESPAEVKQTVKGSPWSGRPPDRRRARDGRDTLRRAVGVLADLELDTRGASGCPTTPSDCARSPRSRAARRGSRRAAGPRGPSCAHRCCGAARRA